MKILGSLCTTPPPSMCVLVMGNISNLHCAKIPIYAPKEKVHHDAPQITLRVLRPLQATSPRSSCRKALLQLSALLLRSSHPPRRISTRSLPRAEAQQQPLLLLRLLPLPVCCIALGFKFFWNGKPHPSQYIYIHSRKNGQMLASWKNKASKVLARDCDHRIDFPPINRTLGSYGRNTWHGSLNVSVSTDGKPAFSRLF
jgi:hypothetical protein